MPLIKAAYALAKDCDKAVYAHVLAAMGDPTGVPTLLEAIRAGGIAAGNKHLGSGGVCGMIRAIGFTRDRRAVPILVELSRGERLKKDFQLVRVAGSRPGPHRRSGRGPSPGRSVGKTAFVSETCMPVSCLCTLPLRRSRRSCSAMVTAVCPARRDSLVPPCLASALLVARRRQARKDEAIDRASLMIMLRNRQRIASGCGYKTMTIRKRGHQ